MARHGQDLAIVDHLQLGQHLRVALHQFGQAQQQPSRCTGFMQAHAVIKARRAAATARSTSAAPPGHLGHHRAAGRVDHRAAGAIAGGFSPVDHQAQRPGQKARAPSQCGKRILRGAGDHIGHGAFLPVCCKCLLLDRARPRRALSALRKARAAGAKPAGMP
jgi:hypothetical protein